MIFNVGEWCGELIRIAGAISLEQCSAASFESIFSQCRCQEGYMPIQLLSVLQSFKRGEVEEGYLYLRGFPFSDHLPPTPLKDQPGELPRQAAVFLTLIAG